MHRFAVSSVVMYAGTVVSRICAAEEKLLKLKTSDEKRRYVCF